MIEWLLNKVNSAQLAQVPGTLPGREGRGNLSRVCSARLESPRVYRSVYPHSPVLVLSVRCSAVQCSVWIPFGPASQAWSRHTALHWCVESKKIESPVALSVLRAHIFHTLHCTALHCTALNCTALHCTALHCASLHCTALHCTALHCTALHCTALHCCPRPALLPHPPTPALLSLPPASLSTPKFPLQQHPASSAPPSLAHPLPLLPRPLPPSSTTLLA
jgi:hypothetical protein